jgi:hypothetical protein
VSPEPSASPKADAAKTLTDGAGGKKLADGDVGPVSGAVPSPSSEGGGGAKDGPLGTVGARIGVGLASVVAIAVVTLAAYKAYESLPEDSLRSVMRISSNTGGGPSPPGSPMPVDESMFAQKWVHPSELPEAAVAAGEAAAAALGGTFAGFMRPGTEKVRPPQVITRTAQPEMLTALSDLKNMTGSLAGRSLSLPLSSLSLSDEAGSVEGADDVVPGMVARGTLGGSRRPKVDLIIVMDASGSMSWQEYRRTKEFFTRAGGLLDTVMGMAEAGSRVSFVEYSYDSVVVSELDDDVDRIKRRVLGSFQGDANNWDRESLYIYEVDEHFGGNALRKVNSLKTKGARELQTLARSQRKKDRGMMSEDGQSMWDEENEDMSIANATEVPPAMNGLSRDAHMALKWSRLEMLPPLANRELERKMERANRLRRILILNAGELTEGGVVDTGLEASLEQTQLCEERGIATIAVGIGNCQDPGLDTLATGDPAAFFSVREAEDLDSIAEDLTHMILSPRFAPSASNLVQQPQPLFFKSKLRSRFHRSHRSPKSLSPQGSGKKRKLWRKSSGSRTGESSGDILRDDESYCSLDLRDPPAPLLQAGRHFVSNQSDLPPWFREQ